MTSTADAAPGALDVVYVGRILVVLIFHRIAREWQMVVCAVKYEPVSVTYFATYGN